MASILHPNVLTFIADGVISKGKAVKLGTDNQHVAQCTATTDKCIGIAQNATTASGDFVEIAMPGGGAKALAKATIALGDQLGVNADGSIQKVASANDRVIGYALDSAVASDMFGVVVQLGMATQTQS